MINSIFASLGVFFYSEQTHEKNKIPLSSGVDCVEIGTYANKNIGEENGQYNLTASTNNVGLKREAVQQVAIQIQPSVEHGIQTPSFLNLDEIVKNVEFGIMCPADIAPLRMLHAKSFPLSYSDEYYNSISNGTNMAGLLITLVARNSVTSISDLSLPDSLPDSQAQYDTKTVKAAPNMYTIDGRNWLLLGSITIKRTCIESGSSEQPKLSAKSISQGFTHGFYIQTLAIDPSARRRGIGSWLLSHIIELASRDATIGAVYLHVITYNISAIEFYKSHGFFCQSRFVDFYSINSKMYDAFLFVKYLGTALPEKPDISFLSRIINSVSSILKSALSGWFRNTSHIEA